MNATRGPGATIPPDRRVYAIGDIHGRADLLEHLLGTIEADLAHWRGLPPTLVFLGDFIDRGPDSAAVTQRLLAGAPASGPLARARFVTLCGNHEDLLLHFLADFSIGPRWFRNGGLDTVRSYLCEQPDAALVQDPRRLQRLLYRALPAEHLRFLSALPSSHAEGGYLFVHAGVRPGVAVERQDPYDLMWMREPFLSEDSRLPVIVVHGHTVVAEPEVRQYRIGIDTGAWRSGRLTAVALEGTERRFLATG